MKRLTILLATLLIISCSDEPTPRTPTGPEPFTDFIGIWHLKSTDGIPVAKVILQADRFLEDERFFKGDPKGSLTTNIFNFSADGTWTADVKLVAESSGIQLTKSLKASGTYTISEFNYERITKEAKTTIIVVIDGDETIEEKDESSSLGTETGTWRRKGDTLTFNVPQSERIQPSQPESVDHQPDEMSLEIVFTSDEDDVADVDYTRDAGADPAPDDIKNQ